MSLIRKVAAVTTGSVVAIAVTATTALAGSAPALAHDTKVSTKSLDNHIDYVVAISIDGLNPDAIRELGEAGTPTLHKMMADGVSTLNARTMLEVTKTLPNHTGMMTSRPASRSYDGHGVMVNDDDEKSTVAKMAEGYIASMFDVAHDRGVSTAMYASKTKFELYNRSWNSEHGAKDKVGKNHGRDKIDKYVRNESESKLTKKLVEHLKAKPKRLTFVHVAGPDNEGHKSGYMGSQYLKVVKTADSQVGQVLAAVHANKKMRGHTAVILTSDHGGLGKEHSNESSAVNFTVPFMVWGEGIVKGDLYALNPALFAAPEVGERPSYSPDQQPVRNAAMGNLALDLLDKPAIPGSQINAGQDLAVFTR